MTVSDVTYETKTVRAVRGLEGRAISKWESQGWELVSQAQGRLQTDIVIRRPKPKVPIVPIVAGLVLVGFAVVALLIVGAVEALSGQGDAAPREPRPTVTSSELGGPSEPASSAVTSSSATQTAQTTTEPTVLTAKNNAELASLLKLGDYCDGSVEKFAKKYEGRTIAFEANVGAMNPHGNAKTRYDILLGAGPYSETTSQGPAFQFRDENTTYDLNYQGDVPDTIGVGTNLYVKAEVKEYEPTSCLFLLEPIETTVRMPK